MQSLYLLLALAAGILMPIQAGINAKLANVVGGSTQAAFVSFLVGTVVLAVVLAALRQAIPVMPALESAPWWYWIGGAMGAFFVTATVILAPRIGAGAMIALSLAGQIGASMYLDHHALLGFPHIPFSFKRLIGSLLLLAGVYLIRF